MRHITSSLGYTLRPASLAIILGILLRHKKSGIILWIPVILVGVISFTSYFTHLSFWFGPQNQFMRGPLCYLPHFVSCLYLLVLVILTIKMHRYISSGEVFSVLYINIICVVATILESILSGYKFLLTGAMIISCALYYVVLYIETFKRDPLTGLLNRRSFYVDARKMRNKTIAIISIDLNSLKEINDSNGHRAGDEALQIMGNAMLVKSGRRFSAYRVGGDEFMALGKDQTPTSVEAFVQEMRSVLQEKHLMASFGYSICSIGDNFDEICNQADAHMYHDKKRYKHRDCLRD